MNRPSTPPEAAKLLEAALDVFVYAPIGLLFEARDVVPKLAERGRGQVTLARFFGRYAIQLGQAEAERVLKATRPTSSTPTDAPLSAEDDEAPAPTPTVPEPVASPAPEPEPVVDVEPDIADSAPSADALPIPGYDTLSASQIVPRLEALRPDELEAVRVYESANRGRRTILNRIAQRQA